MKIPINIKVLPLIYHHWTHYKDLWFSAQRCVISLHCVKWNTNLNSYISCTVNVKQIKRCPLLVSGYASLLLWQWHSNIYWHTSCWWAIWQSQVGLKLERREKVLVKKKIKNQSVWLFVVLCLPPHRVGTRGGSVSACVTGQWCISERLPEGKCLHFVFPHLQKKTNK